MTPVLKCLHRNAPKTRRPTSTGGDLNPYRVAGIYPIAALAISVELLDWA